MHITARLAATAPLTVHKPSLAASQQDQTRRVRHGVCAWEASRAKIGCGSDVHCGVSTIASTVAAVWVLQVLQYRHTPSTRRCRHQGGYRLHFSACGAGARVQVAAHIHQEVPASKRRRPGAGVTVIPAGSSGPMRVTLPIVAANSVPSCRRSLSIASQKAP